MTTQALILQTYSSKSEGGSLDKLFRFRFRYVNYIAIYHYFGNEFCDMIEEILYRF